MGDYHLQMGSGISFRPRALPAREIVAKQQEILRDQEWCSEEIAYSIIFASVYFSIRDQNDFTQTNRHPSSEV